MFVDVTLIGVPLDVIEWSKRMVAWQKQHSLKATDADMAGIERDDHLKLVERSLRPFFSGYEDLAPESKGGFVRRAPAGILAVADIDHRPGRFNVEVE